MRNLLKRFVVLLALVGFGSAISLPAQAQTPPTPPTDPGVQVCLVLFLDITGVVTIDQQPCFTPVPLPSVF